jgi:hypothetical protein
MKNFISGVMVQLNELTLSTHKTNTDIFNSNLDDTLNTTMNSFIRDYKNMFETNISTQETHISNISHSSEPNNNRLVRQGHNSLLNNHKQKRYKSFNEVNSRTQPKRKHNNTESISQGFRIGSKRVSQCSFCHNTNHNISNCQNKKSLITTANGRVIETYDETETFINYMRTGPRDLLDYTKSEISIYKGLLRTTKNKHIVVHNLYPKEKKEIMKQHWNLCDMVFCISLVQYDGTIDISNKEILVPGNEFETYILTMANNKKRYVFDCLGSQKSNFDIRDKIGNRLDPSIGGSQSFDPPGSFSH